MFRSSRPRPAEDRLWPTDDDAPPGLPLVRDPVSDPVRHRTPRWSAWVLTGVELMLVAAYGYGAVAYLTSDAGYFPEQAPPLWSWPAVIVVGIGYVPAVICLLAALPALTSPALRAERRRWWWLGVASAATVVMLLVMATPLGWELFDWYVD